MKNEVLKCVLCVLVAVIIIIVVTWLQILGIPTGFGVQP